MQYSQWMTRQLIVSHVFERWREWHRPPALDTQTVCLAWQYCDQTFAERVSFYLKIMLHLCIFSLILFRSHISFILTWLFHFFHSGSAHIFLSLWLGSHIPTSLARLTHSFHFPKTRIFLSFCFKAQLIFRLWTIIWCAHACTLL